MCVKYQAWQIGLVMKYFMSINVTKIDSCFQSDVFVSPTRLFSRTNLRYSYIYIFIFFSNLHSFNNKLPGTMQGEITYQFFLTLRCTLQYKTKNTNSQQSTLITLYVASLFQMYLHQSYFFFCACCSMFLSVLEFFVLSFIACFYCVETLMHVSFYYAQTQIAFYP